MLPLTVGGDVGDRRAIAPTGGDDDVAGAPARGTGDDLEAVAAAVHRLDGRVLLDGCGEVAGIGGEVPGEGGGGHEPVRVTTAVAPHRQGVEPVGAEQVQRVPRLAAPALGDAATFEHDVVAPRGGEAIADGETGLPGPDDDGVDEICH